MRASGKIALVFVVVTAFGLGGGLLWLKHGPRHTPATQPPLATLDAASLDGFRAAFNAHSDQAQVLTLLSPT